MDIRQGGTIAFCQDAIAFCHQIGGGAGFGREAGTKRRDAPGEATFPHFPVDAAPSVFAMIAS